MTDENPLTLTRHGVEVVLALSAVNAIKPSDSRFLINPSLASLPTQPLALGQDALEVAEQLLKRLTGTSPTWLPLEQVGTVTGRQDGIVIVLYAMTMPEKAPLLDADFDWVDFETLGEYPEPLKLFAYACNAYRIGVPK